MYLCIAEKWNNNYNRPSFFFIGFISTNNISLQMHLKLYIKKQKKAFMDNNSRLFYEISYGMSISCTV